MGSYVPRAFVLFNVESDSEDEVLEELIKIEGMQEAYVSYGAYDLIAIVKADTMEKLLDAITNKMRKINKVRKTLTLVLMGE
jgi:DNA-binding Lrp family transcriptional regulator